MDFRKAAAHARAAMREQAASARQAPGAAPGEQALMQFTSHIEGRNAAVAIYPDRIDWARTRLNLGLGQPPGHQHDPGARQGVSTHKGGLGYTSVRVTTAGEATEFRVSKSQAEDVRATLLRLMSQPAGPAPSTGRRCWSPTSCASSGGCGTPGCCPRPSSLSRRPGC